MQDVDIRVDQAFWASSILPEGIVQQWFIADGSIAETGDKMAEIRIEDALHEITAPVRGRLKIVGFVIFHVVAEVSEIYNIAVEAANARSGIGKQLMWAAITASGQRAAKRVILEVRKSNAAAIQDRRASTAPPNSPTPPATPDPKPPAICDHHLAAASVG